MIHHAHYIEFYVITLCILSRDMTRPGDMIPDDMIPVQMLKQQTNTYRLITSLKRNKDISMQHYTAQHTSKESVTSCRV